MWHRFNRSEIIQNEIIKKRTEAGVNCFYYFLRLLFQLIWPPTRYNKTKLICCAHPHYCLCHLYVITVISPQNAFFLFVSTIKLLKNIRAQFFKLEFHCVGPLLHATVCCSYQFITQACWLMNVSEQDGLNVRMLMAKAAARQQNIACRTTPEPAQRLTNNKPKRCDTIPYFRTIRPLILPLLLHTSWNIKTSNSPQFILSCSLVVSLLL